MGPINIGATKHAMLWVWFYNLQLSTFTILQLQKLVTSDNNTMLVWSVWSYQKLRIEDVCVSILTVSLNFRLWFSEQNLQFQRCQDGPHAAQVLGIFYCAVGIITFSGEPFFLCTHHQLEVMIFPKWWMNDKKNVMNWFQQLNWWEMPLNPKTFWGYFASSLSKSMSGCNVKKLLTICWHVFLLPKCWKG